MALLHHLVPSRETLTYYGLLAVYFFGLHVWTEGFVVPFDPSWALEVAMLSFIALASGRMLGVVGPGLVFGFFDWLVLEETEPRTGVRPITIEKKSASGAGASIPAGEPVPTKTLRQLAMEVALRNLPELIHFVLAIPVLAVFISIRQRADSSLVSLALLYEVLDYYPYVLRLTLGGVGILYGPLVLLRKNRFARALHRATTLGWGVLAYALAVALVGQTYSLGAEPLNRGLSFERVVAMSREYVQLYGRCLFIVQLGRLLSVSIARCLAVRGTNLALVTSLPAQSYHPVATLSTHLPLLNPILGTALSALVTAASCWSPYYSYLFNLSEARTVLVWTGALAVGIILIDGALYAFSVWYYRCTATLDEMAFMWVLRRNTPAEDGSVLDFWDRLEEVMSVDEKDAAETAESGTFWFIVGMAIGLVGLYFH